QARVQAIVRASQGAAQAPARSLTLGGLAALQQRARLVVGVDSGALHLAAAMDASVVGLYGPADPGEFGPWLPRDRYRVVRSDLLCSPCHTMIDPPCGARTAPVCMAGIPVAAVLAAVHELLGGVTAPAVPTADTRSMPYDL